MLRTKLVGFYYEMLHGLGWGGSGIGFCSQSDMELFLSGSKVCTKRGKSQLDGLFLALQILEVLRSNYGGKHHPEVCLGCWGVFALS